MTDSTSQKRNEHAIQEPPYEWRAVEHGDEVLIAREVPEGETEPFVVTSTTRNVRALAHADAFLYRGSVVEPWFEEDYRSVDFCHSYAGRVDSFHPEEWLHEPAIRLKRLPTVDLPEVL